MTPLVLPSWLTLVVCVLAAARVFRLLTADEITEWLHSGLVARLPEVLVSGWFCRWCLGYWLGAGAVATALAWGDTIVWQLLALPLAVNYCYVGLAARLED